MKLKDLKCNLIFYPDLPSSFAKEIELFVKALYAVEQNKLERKHHSSSEKGDKRWDINPYELTVCSSAACVDLLFWAVREEPGMYVLYIFLSYDVAVIKWIKSCHK